MIDGDKLKKLKAIAKRHQLTIGGNCGDLGCKLYSVYTARNLLEKIFGGKYVHINIGSDEFGQNFVIVWPSDMNYDEFVTEVKACLSI